MSAAKRQARLYLSLAREAIALWEKDWEQDEKTTFSLSDIQDGWVEYMGDVIMCGDLVPIIDMKITHDEYLKWETHCDVCREMGSKYANLENYVRMIRSNFKTVNNL